MYDPYSGNDGSRSPALYEGVGPAIARPGGQGLDGQLRLFVAPASMPQQLRIADRETLPGDPFFFSGVGGCGRRPSPILDNVHGILDIVHGIVDNGYEARYPGFGGGAGRALP